MLIALIGPPGSGKASVANYLVSQHGFQLLTLNTAASQQLDGASEPSPKTTALPDSKVMLDYVTDRWNHRFVTLDLSSVGDLEAFIKRPFFLCVEVGGPLLMRWARYQRKHGDIALESFVQLDDSLTFGVGNSLAATASNGTRGESRISMVHSDSSSSLLTGGNGIVDNLAATSLHDSSSNSSSPSSSGARSTRGLTALRRYVHLSITNDHASITALHSHLDTLRLTSEERLRPCWDTYFLKLCNLASLRSNCMKRRVGAVLVAQNRILSTGYNGTPSGLRNCNHGGCARCNNTLSTLSPTTTMSNGTPDAGSVAAQRAGSSACGQNLDECLCLHAEENALLEAGRAKVGTGATMYCNTCPCLRCAVKIIQTGIKHVVYQLEYSMDQRTKAIFADAGVEIRQFHLDT